mmetsp:Transcript_46743/g.69141  ORF Transcript_46743/g.69141 Transcript_46743/m.69141 type:complete len:378 (+) Transcript_46743:155-1288(+)|eukprot:CAMPEP_0195528860 /NCGR_PEP_ID=MMETSP0794_2-20130614/31212_1 /TAXON_ID=515487 /ORGANISM="Stephanopyxis turris, Strain CCMP 815" /LENGTH=377 /DNA_ID=CAMNT_0040660071 /DNA_START=90 /DNA_END=1223 /DNA_ORIENTATION=+
MTGELIDQANNGARTVSYQNQHVIESVKESFFYQRFFRPLFFGKVAKCCWVVLVWIATTAGLYCLVNKWPWPTAFYASVDSGFSIGFGAVAEPTNLSLMITILHVCVGAGVIAAVLAFLAESLAESLPQIKEEQRLKLQEAANKLDKDGDGEVTRRECIACFWENVKLFVYTNNSFLYTLTSFLVWVVVGMIGMSLFERDWSVLRLIYFSLTAMSTGGLQSASLDPENCRNYETIGKSCFLYPGEAIFIGIYCIVGVPLYGAILGKIAEVFLKRWARNREEEIIASTLSKEDEAKSQLFIEDTNTTSWNEFLIMKLVAMDKVDIETLTTLKQVFEHSDKDHSGSLSIEEIESTTPEEIRELLNTIKKNKPSVALDLC